MSKAFRTVISLAVAIVLLLSAAIPVTAAKADSAQLPLIIVNGMGESPLLNVQGEKAWPPSGDAITKAALKVVALLPIVPFSRQGFADRAYPILRELFDDIVFNPDGTSKHTLGQVRFPDSYAEDKTGLINTISHGGLARRYGSEISYQYVVDWRDAAAEADGLNAMIERVKKNHNADKVNIIAVSMGGAAAMSYLAKYGHGSIQNLIMMHTVFQGLPIVGDLFNKRITLEGENLRRWLAQSMAGNDPWAGIVGGLLACLDDNGTLDFVLNILENFIGLLEPQIFDELLTPVFAQLPGFWGLVPDADYESAKALLLDPVEHKTLIKTIDDYHYNVFNKADELFAAANKDGVNIYVLSGYNLAGAPIGSYANVHTDDGLATPCTSGGATCAPLGQTLGDNYKQAVNDGHNHLSADGFIDASTCLLPEQTWFQKDMHHTGFSSADSHDFMMWLLSSKTRLSIHSNKAYPQFMQLINETGQLIPLT